MDCRKLSPDACLHAVQNERLPLRVVVQVLFFEQMRASSASAGDSTPDLPSTIRALLPGSGSHGSSRSTTTNTEDDWDAIPTIEEIRALKGELAALKLGSGDRNGSDIARNNAEKVSGNKMKGMLISKKIFSKLWSNKDRNGEISSSETSESPGSSNAEETKSTPSRSQRHSIS